MHIIELHFCFLIWKVETLAFPTMLLETCVRPFLDQKCYISSLILRTEAKEEGVFPTSVLGTLCKRFSARYLLSQADFTNSSWIWFLTCFYAAFFSGHTLDSTTRALLRAPSQQRGDISLPYMTGGQEGSLPVKARLTSHILILSHHPSYNYPFMKDIEWSLQSLPLFKHGKYLANWYGGLTK